MMVIFDDRTGDTSFFLLTEEKIRSLSAEFADCVVEMDEVLQRPQPCRLHVVEIARSETDPQAILQR